MLGRKLAERLARDGTLGGEPVDGLLLVDVVEPERPTAAFDIDTTACDLAGPGVAEELVSGRPDVVFHLAAVLSGEAEANFEKGYRVNLDGTRLLFDAIRAHRRLPPAGRFRLDDRRLRGAVPRRDRRRFAAAADELRDAEGDRRAAAVRLLRRGFFDGVGVRLPTICVRPGEPNKAASGFFSGIIREPLPGRRRYCRSPKTSATGRFTARRDRVPAPRREDRQRELGTGGTSACPASAATVGDRSRRCARLPATRPRA